MTEVLSLTWVDFDQAVRALVGVVSTFGRPLYGIPSGGLCLAVALSKATELRLITAPEDGMVVVDDITDSGATLINMANCHLINGAVVWVSRHRSWQAAPWVKSALHLDDDREVTFPWAPVPHDAPQARAR
jgi:xanthine phosphoribosyltransferase